MLFHNQMLGPDVLFCFTPTQAAGPDDVPPVLTTPHHYLINIYRNQLYFVAVVTTEGQYINDMSFGFLESS